MKMTIYLLMMFTAMVNCSGYSQNCDPASLLVREVRAKDTDPNIQWELFRHFTYFNPSCSSRNTLLVHLPGTSDEPESTTLFPSLAANCGFHVINLKYPNNNGSAYGACGSSTDSDCYLNFRKEILEGIDYSGDVAVDQTNSIFNRMLKLLEYMSANYPDEGWEQYLINSEIDWSKIIMSGHSQGGGHAAVIAIDHPIKRILMFASPNDYSDFFGVAADWTNLQAAVPDSAYYGFINYYDQILGNTLWQYSTWANLGISNFGDTVNVDEVSAPYNQSHQLYTKIDLPGPLGVADHSVMLLDNYTTDNNGQLLYKEVWLYMLGVSQHQLSVQEFANKSLFSLYPNPVNGIITIETNVPYQYGELKIFSVTGKELEVTYDLINPQLVRVDLSRFKEGVYFIRYSTENQIQTKPIIVN